MKYDTWDERQWFLFGAAYTASKAFWDNEGNTNKQIITGVSSDGSIGTVGYTPSENGGSE